ncbi:hypothetical protein [Planctomycetes bacterium K23_9]|uniref:Ribonuclease HIII n=1 Tax=Stieleria marina TaxID=1930275 RepID=A0A517NWI3_9BACT|nr:Hypothetical protein K239x_34820 [Planctomycetes bacterium K23_9]
MKIIATDEAGYGPKLGPLVVGATAWRVADEWRADSPDQLADRFALLKKPLKCQAATVVVDDSKSVFKSKSVAKGNVDPLANLHATVSAANRWCHSTAPAFDQWLSEVAAEDVKLFSQVPWLVDLPDVAFENHDRVDGVVDSWSAIGAALQEFRCRVITANAFNQACESGLNKADLLSQTTLSLVRDVLQRQTIAADEPVQVFCDRHGGRRYYASVLQHVFEDSEVTVVSESKQQSVYQLRYRGVDATVHFTVKGDSFTPVAMSSIYAKYIRERLMQSFNRYFQSIAGPGHAVQPTAGYPVDADRFLLEIQPLIKKQRIDLKKLVRKR